MKYISKVMTINSIPSRHKADYTRYNNNIHKANNMVWYVYRVVGI